MGISKKEFLNRLKDPLKAKLINAAKEFEDAHADIHNVVVFKESLKNIYYIDVYAVNPDILTSTRKSFIETVDKHLSNRTWIGERTRDGDEYQHGLYRHSYFIDLLPGTVETLMRQLAQEIVDSVDEEIIKELRFPPKQS